MSAVLPPSAIAPLSSPTDTEILDAISSMNTPMTYVICHWLARTHKGLKTPSVRRRLNALEKAGKVKRVPSMYERQICWGVVDLARTAPLRRT